MLIILILYLVLVWLLFFKLKLIGLSWLSGTFAGVIGAIILAVFVALLANLAPSGRFVINAPVVTITPNVSGQVIALPIQPNVPLKAGAVLFQIDPSPFQYKVKQIEAQLAAAKQNVQQLKACYDQVTANVQGLTSQLAFHTKRLSDISTESAQGATTLFRLQDTQNQVDAVKAQLLAAQAAQLNAKLALDSEIDGVHTTVAQLQAQLDDAKWNLLQTTIRAPADGYVTTIGLSVGDRALEHSSVLSFVVADQVKIIGMFSPNGFRAIKPGTAVKLVFDEVPGRIYHTTVTTVPRGVGQGQIAASGTLARVGSIEGVDTYPAVISVPQEIDPEFLRIGMPGTATVISDKAGVIGLVASILLWVKAYTAYL
jgi:multidrug resistance efflux pump